MTEQSDEIKILSCFLESTKKAFQIQLSTAVDISKTAHENTTFEIGSFLGLSCSKFSGTLAVLFPRATFLGLVNRMLGENYKEITDENADAAGEFLNIIYGVGRPPINDLGFDFSLSLPSTTRGDNLKISHGSGGFVFPVYCKTDLGTFKLEMSLKTKQGKP